ncbi:YCII-related domain protein [Posidoniimonas polymericola]|uniref:YCII-related domain protein n=1 Tax=Posidoniimonas polymericola TaxID=2528002 RepID=A0A5C5YGX4_9BACT|nr:YciI family protein [Posidoniimonas polymericola]TWT74444.1 YCII-related domain protein [Posidoniimonas polymericola]
MKFVCLGYYDESTFASYSEEEMKAHMEACFAYDDELRRGGHFLGGEALQGGEAGVVLRHRAGKTAVTDGPYSETKEHLGGILLLEARDLNHAIALMSKHPGVRFGPFEVRPANEEINAMIAERTAALGTDA